VPETFIADSRFDANGKPSGCGDQLNEVKQGILVVKGRVVAGAPTVHADWNPADRRDLRGDLRTRQQPANTCLSALADLDFNCLDWLFHTERHKLLKVEVTAGIANSEVARPNLEE
jgi:hypothetical protein